ncbi:MAG: RNA methyltransferase [Candidatus Kapaibacteriales bacterium]
MRKLLHHEIVQRRLTVEEAHKLPRFPLTLVLHNVRSLYNVGSIFRTCDAGRVRELILCGFTPCPPRKEIDKTALGAVETVPWRYFLSTVDAISYLKEQKNKVFALEITDRMRSYDSLQQNEFPSAFILGNELVGVEQEILDFCDDAIEIPMFGVKHSLNVAVAAGIVIFEAIKVCRQL